MAGSERYASATSAFRFHQTSWSFSAASDLPIGVIENATSWLTEYEKMMRQTIAAKTHLVDADIAKMMGGGKIMLAAEAKANGLISDVKDAPFPHDARWWQV